MKNRKYHYNGRHPTKRMKQGPKPTTDRERKRKDYRAKVYGASD